MAGKSTVHYMDKIIMGSTGQIVLGAVTISVTNFNAKLTAAKAASVAAVATADATDLPTVIALANQLKSTLNTLIAGQKTAGQML